MPECHVGDEFYNRNSNGWVRSDNWKTIGEQASDLIYRRKL